MLSRLAMCSSAHLSQAPSVVARLSWQPVSGSMTGRFMSGAAAAGGGRSQFMRRAAKRGATLRERVMAPSGPGAFSVGKGVVAGASAIGIGALCYYGAGLSSEMGAIDRASVWPEYVRERVRRTYLYFGGSVLVTAASVAAIVRSPAALSLVTRHSWMAVGVSLAAMIGSGMLVRSLPYQPGSISAKQLAWLAHCGVIGAVIAPLALLGGPIMLRAAWYTGGVVASLSTLAVCAPSEKFLNMRAPLAIGLGVVFCASLGSMFLPATTTLGASLYSLSVYGGLVLFSMFLLYDTQRIISAAETHSPYSGVPFDPVNASVSIYLDTINIFIRLAMILAGGGGRRK